MLRLGMRLIKGLDQHSTETISDQREKHTFTSLPHFRQLTQLHRDQLALLAKANAFTSLTENRYLNTWQSLDREVTPDSNSAHTPANSVEDNTYSDYDSTGLSLREHPIALLRRRDQFRNYANARDLVSYQDGQQVILIGLVTCRQRPGSAAGVMFLTLEDETGTVNVVLWEKIQQRYRKEIKQGKILEIGGTLQVNADRSEGDFPVIHLVGLGIRCLEWQKLQSVRSFR